MIVDQHGERTAEFRTLARLPGPDGALAAIAWDGRRLHHVVARHVVVDAPAECYDKAEEYLAEHYFEDRRLKVERDLATPRVGSRVKIDLDPRARKNRDVNRAEGVVVWEGEDRYDAKRRRLGVRIDGEDDPRWFRDTAVVVLHEPVQTAAIWRWAQREARRTVGAWRRQRDEGAA